MSLIKNAAENIEENIISKQEKEILCEGVNPRARR
jgi:hypothetical protein